MYGNRDRLKFTKFTKVIKVSVVADELQSEREDLLQVEASLWTLDFYLWNQMARCQAQLFPLIDMSLWAFDFTGFSFFNVKLG